MYIICAIITIPIGYVFVISRRLDFCNPTWWSLCCGSRPQVGKGKLDVLDLGLPGLSHIIHWS